MLQRAGRLSDTSLLAWPGAADKSVDKALMLACRALFESPLLKHTRSVDQAREVYGAYTATHARELPITSSIIIAERNAEPFDKI